MSDNVTPIRPERRTVELAEPEFGPSTMRLIQALHGVCAAAEATAEMAEVHAVELGTAAEILARMLQERLSIPSE